MLRKTHLSIHPVSPRFCHKKLMMPLRGEEYVPPGEVGDAVMRSG